MGRKLINDNVNTVLKILFSRLGLRYGTDILGKMKEHPNFPSFLSFQYILKHEGIDSIALKTNIESLRNELPKPVLIHIITNTDLYLLVDHVDDANVHIINEQGKIELESIEKIIKVWTGNAMIFDSNNIVPRIASFQKRAFLLLNKLRIPFIFFIALCVPLYHLIKNTHDIYNYLFMLFSIVGFLFSVLLLIENFDEHNPIVRKFCTSKKSKKVNCTSILNSKDAYFLGLFSWSDIGLVYFTFIFLTNLFMPNDLGLAASCILSVLAFPYVFYSITYQRFVAKSWCRLCLGVQCVLIGNFILAIFSFHSFELSILRHSEKLIPTSLLLLAISATYMAIKPLLAKSYELRYTSYNYRVLKHNEEVKQFLFKKQHLVIPPSACSIIAGNYEGATCLTIVISPVCNPCMNELKILLPILKEKNNTKVEILFFTDKKEDDPFAYNLAKNLIDEYLNNSSNFISFLQGYVENYPASKFKLRKYNSLQSEDNAEQMLKEQIKWCIVNKLYSTPKIFIDGRELPSFYSNKDIDYMCF